MVRAADAAVLTFQSISVRNMSVSGIARPVRLAFVSTFLLLSLGLITWAQESRRDEVIRKCETYFGPRIGSSPVIFEIDRHYVLNVEFDSEGRLEVARVEPKYYYEADYPEWEQAADFKMLSQDQVSNLVSRIDQVKPIGTLVKKYDEVIFVTNKTASITDEYEEAFVEFGNVIDLSLPDDAPTQMRYVEVRYKNLPRSPKSNR